MEDGYMSSTASVELAESTRSSPLVSVVIPAFNAEKTICRAIDSALRQNYRPIEILVIDDASTDNTAAIVQARTENEILLLQLERNLGECAAMNCGLERAQGTYIAFLDADDEWLETKLEKQIRLLETHPGTSFVTCGCVFVSEFGGGSYEFGLSIAPLDPREVWKVLLERASIAKPCVVARRSALERVGPFDPALIVAGDQDMWIRLAAMEPVGIVPEILVRCHDTPNSLTKKYATRIADFMLPMIERHIERQRFLLSRAEINLIRGERYSLVGRNLYNAGETGRGAAYLIAAALRGYRVVESLWYIITASHLSRWMKTRLLGRKSIPMDRVPN
jgi:glycosyltransferase involved in cell wall biosynthesis